MVGGWQPPEPEPVRDPAPRSKNKSRCRLNSNKPTPAWWANLFEQADTDRVILGRRG